MIEDEVGVGKDGERKRKEQHKMRDSRGFCSLHVFMQTLFKSKLRCSWRMIHQVREHVSRV